MQAKIKIDNGKIVRHFSATLFNENDKVKKRDDCTRFIALANLVAEVETQHILQNIGDKLNVNLDTAQNLKNNELIINLRLKGMRLEFDRQDSMQRLCMWVNAFVFETKLKFAKN